MNKLVRNELYKLFHKKSTYIYLFIITVLLVLISYISNKSIQLANNNDFDSMIATSQSNIESFKDNNKILDEFKDSYVQELANIDSLKLAKERNVDVLSAEYDYIKSKVYALYLVKYNVIENGYSYSDFGYLSEEDFNNKLNETIKKLDNFVPIEEVKNDLNNLNKEQLCKSVSKKYCDEYYNVYKSVLEYRINNNIPYTQHENSNVLTSYLEAYLTYLELRDNKNLSKEKKDEYREVLKTVKLTQYRMEHNLIDNKKNVDLGSASFIASPIDENTIFLIFGIIVIACGIFSEEFDKGTIKQLLIKPYSRNKIAVAKIITCLIATLIFLIYFIIVNILCGQLLISAFDINSTVLMYDYNLEKVLVYNGFQLIGLYLLYKLPYLILFTLIILLVSVITRNTAISAVSGFMLIILPEILSLLIDKFKPLAYLPFYTWRLDEFMFGGRSTIKQLTFNNSLILDIVYIVIFSISLIIVFKRTDIKNQ